jgi:hypothetical protein
LHKLLLQVRRFASTADHHDQVLLPATLPPFNCVSIETPFDGRIEKPDELVGNRLSNQRLIETIGDGVKAQTSRRLAQASEGRSEGSAKLGTALITASTSFARRSQNDGRFAVLNFDALNSGREAHFAPRSSTNLAAPDV